MPLWNAWTDDEKQAFREVAPGKTGQQIANILTERFGRPITRSAIAGQCRRLGVSLMKDDPEMRKRCDLAKQAKAAAKDPYEYTSVPPKVTQTLPAKIIHSEPLPELPGCTITELTHDRCKYPLWGAVRATIDSRYCGGLVECAPYCEDHRKVAYSWDPFSSRKTVKVPAKPAKSTV